MWQHFVEIWSESIYFRGALALFLVGLYVVFK